MRFDLDTEIRYPSGERAGVLRRVIMDENNEVVEVVLATDGLVSRSVLVPVDRLSEAPGGVLTVTVSDEELDSLPDYEEERMPAVPEGWQFPDGNAPGSDAFPATMLQPIIPVVEVSNVQEGELSISQGTQVWCLDGPWGVVDEVLSDENSRVYAFLGRSDLANEHDRVIPIELVERADAGQVTLNCQLADLPTYTQEMIDEQKDIEL